MALYYALKVVNSSGVRNFEAIDKEWLEIKVSCWYYVGIKLVLGWYHGFAMQLLCWYHVGIMDSLCG